MLQKKSCSENNHDAGVIHMLIIDVLDNCLFWNKQISVDINDDDRDVFLLVVHNKLIIFLGISFD